MDSPISQQPHRSSKPVDAREGVGRWVRFPCSTDGLAAAGADPTAQIPADPARNGHDGDGTPPGLVGWLESSAPICAGLGTIELLTCDFCGGSATCIGVGGSFPSPSPLAACDECCGHSQDVDDGGPCVPARGATVLDWPALAERAAEVAP